jgi:MFS family permease
VARFGRNVVLLAVTSFLADISGEMLQAVLAFLLVLQGASGLAIGLTGGASDAVGHLLKPVFGALADRLRKRKPIVVGGYALAALARVGIAASATWEGSLLWRSADRVGKGMRTAPRDAILAESAPKETRGRTFGLHRAADTAGAVVGVALALAAVAWLSLDEPHVARIVLVAALIGLTTLVPLALVKDDGAAGGGPVGGGGKAAFEPASPRYRAFLLAVGVLSLGQVSYLFYILRAATLEGGALAAIALYLLYNVVYAALSLPMGTLSDKWGRGRVLAAGALVFAASSLLLAESASWPLAVASFVLYGLAFAMTDGVQRAMASDLAGSAGRSTRLGWFHATVGLAAVLGGVAAGWLWDRYGEGATFAFGASVPILGLALLAAGGFVRRRVS